MFDFPERRDICLKKMKEAFDMGLHGADEVVIHGDARALFDRPEVKQEERVDHVEEDEGGEANMQSIKEHVKDMKVEEDMEEGVEEPKTHVTRGTRKRKGDQATLDSMVTRGKAKKSS